MTELDKLTSLMSDTDALAQRIARAHAAGLVSTHRATTMLDKLSDVAGGFQSMLTDARARAAKLPTSDN